MTCFQVPYMSRHPLWETEKPYFVESAPKSGLQGLPTNYILEKDDMAIRCMGPGDDFDLDVHGFCVMKERTELDPEAALHYSETVEGAYTSQVRDILLRRFPQYKAIEAIDFVVRKRDARFPSEEPVQITHEQPAGLMHTDYTIDGAMMQLDYTFPKSEGYFKNKDFDMLNVWRPLVGPNDDWPLTVCDYTSVDLDNDIIHADLLYDIRIGENQLLHHNPNHRWYYIPAQEPDDLVVFRHVDSFDKRPKAFHGSFFNPGAKGPPRQSCEVRFVAVR